LPKVLSLSVARHARFHLSLSKQLQTFPSGFARIEPVPPSLYSLASKSLYVIFSLRRE